MRANISVVSICHAGFPGMVNDGINGQLVSGKYSKALEMALGNLNSAPEFVITMLKKQEKRSIKSYCLDYGKK